MATAHRPIKPFMSPRAKLVLCAVFALIWNALGIPIVIHIVRQEPHSLVFLSPVLMVGAALLGGCVYFFLALFNPRPSLSLSSSGAKLGETFSVEWEIRGRAGRIRRLHIFLKGFETATYKRGNDRFTPVNVFAMIDAVDTYDKSEIRRGRSDVTVPASTMHSFEAPYNRVGWSIRLEGEIGGWPDIGETYPFNVLPLESAGGAAS